MPEMHVRESGFTYNSCVLFKKNKTGDSRYIY